MSQEQHDTIKRKFYTAKIKKIKKTIRNRYEGNDPRFETLSNTTVCTSAMTFRSHSYGELIKTALHILYIQITVFKKTIVNINHFPNFEKTSLRFVIKGNLSYNIMTLETLEYSNITAVYYQSDL